MRRRCAQRASANPDRMRLPAVMKSTLTCPHCGFAEKLAMPTESCPFFHACGGGAMLKPQPGDCCVFCSYGNVPCPPRQREGA